MAALARLLFAPLRSRIGRRAVLVAVVLGALWWWQGERIRRWFGPPRLPEGHVSIEFVPEHVPAPDAQFEARYGGLSAERLRAHLVALEERYDRERRAALDRRRRAGDVIERPYAAGSATAVPPQVPADAIFEVVYDPVESVRTPVAWTIWLPREGHADLYALRDELRALRALRARVEAIEAR